MNKPKLSFLIALGLIILLAGQLAAWDDEELFYTQVKPNIVITLDNSGSMRNIIFHPDYQPVIGTGTFEPKIAAGNNGYQAQYLRKNRYVARWFDGTNSRLFSATAHNTALTIGPTTYRTTSAAIVDTRNDSGFTWYRIGTTSTGGALDDHFLVNAKIIIGSRTGTTGNTDTHTYYQDALATIAEKKQIPAGGNWYVRFSDISGGPIPVGATAANVCMQTIVPFPPEPFTRRIVKLYGGNDNPLDPLSSETVYSQTDGTTANENDYLEWIFNTATEAQRDEVEWFADHGSYDLTDATNYTNTQTRMRVARHALTKDDDLVNNDNNGIIEQFKDRVQMGLFYLSLPTQVSGVTDMSDGPSRTALKNAINGLTPTNPQGTPLGETASDVWLYYKNSTVIDWHCRKSFQVLLTDGQPNGEDRTGANMNVTDTRPDATTEGPHNILLPWSNATHQFAITAPWPTLAPAQILPGSGSTAHFSLINAAYYMSHNDAKPVIGTGPDETKIQNVSTYTIGFTTSGISNLVMSQTATNGGGGFYTANDFSSLVNAFETILGAIMEKSQAFAAFTAPKLTTVDGGTFSGYVSTFIPQSGEALWEGHLKAYTLEANGNLPTDTAGNLKETPPTFDGDGKVLTGGKKWDAATLLTAKTPSTRDLWTWLDDEKKNFLASNFSNADLAATDNAQRTLITAMVRGDNAVAAPAPAIYPYLNDNGTIRRLGDIFHFQPIVVGEPQKWKTAFDPSFKAFYDLYKTRIKAVYAGANDGMMHCFDADTGEELWGFLPALGLKKLRNIGLNDGHEYFVDGQGAVADVKISTATTADSWRSMLVFGLGLGGPGYYALDITEPDQTPATGFRWELSVPVHGPNAGKTVLITGSGTQTVINDPKKLLAPTMGKPAIGHINYGGRRTPIVVLTGGYDESIATSSPAGKSLFILNAYTGAIIKSFIYGSTSNSNIQQASPELLYSLPSGAKLVDFHNDGLVDAIYVADIGGNIWKIDITSSSSSNWQLRKLFNTTATITGGLSAQAFFVSPTVGLDDLYRVWIYAGTGDRANPNSQTSTGKFFGLMEPPVGTVYTPNDLDDITWMFHADASDDSDGDGWKDTTEIANGKSIYNPDDHPDPLAIPPDVLATDKHTRNASTKGIKFDLTAGMNASGSTLLTAGEKLFEPTPILMNFQVIFNTYLPPSVTGGGTLDPCNPAGDMFVYQFRLNAGANGDTIDATASVKARILGSGLLTGDQYNIYYGTGEVGSQTVTATNPLDLKRLFGRMYWIENRR